MPCARPQHASDSWNATFAGLVYFGDTALSPAKGSGRNFTPFGIFHDWAIRTRQSKVEESTMTNSEGRRNRPHMHVVHGLLVLSLVTITMPSARAESLQEIAEHTHFHGISFNRAGGDATLLVATHHGMFAVMRDGSTAQISTTQDFMGFSPDPADPMRYFGSGHPAGGGNSGFLETRDGGATWQQLSDGVNGPVDFHSLAVSTANPRIIYGVFDGIQMSADRGLNWQITGSIPDGLVQLTASSVDSRRIFAATKSGLKVSSDTGATWGNASFDGEIVSAIRIEPDGTIYAFVLGHGFLRSNEANLADWVPLSNSLGQAIPLHIALNPKDPNHLILSTQTSELLESLDGGKNWKLFGQLQ